MDLSKLASTLLSSDSVKGISKSTGVSNKDVKNVLAEALPSLLSGATSQAKDSSTSKSFATALSDHAKSDTSDLKGFLSNVDLKDGSKIITHLLGSDKSNITKSVSKSTGVSSSKTNDVLSAVGPLLMSLMGQQADKDENKSSGVETLIGSLLDNVDVTELLTGALTSSSSKKATKKTTKKTSTKKKAASSDSSSGGILGSLFKLLK
ncbi:MAG: DUF937 domain-containing protein [Lachnospira sp.]|nr:DUF937 domain-containing protein [Lachnospira sp.]